MDCDKEEKRSHQHSCLKKANGIYELIKRLGYELDDLGLTYYYTSCEMASDYIREVIEALETELNEETK